jgi:hypothetical protein
MALSIPIISEFNNKGIKRAQQEFKQLETVGQKAQFAIRKAAIPAAIAVAAIGKAAQVALKAGEEVNSANNRIRQINKSMGLFGKQTEIVNKRLIKLAEAQARELGISNLTIKATKAKLLTFKNLAQSANVVGGAFDRANRAALDLAAAGFGSAEGNAVQLGKALENPIKGLAALTRSGIDFTDQEKEKIRTLVESNRMLEAQEIILEAIEKQVGGTAKATADDTKKMREAFDQFKQTLGLSLLPVLEEVTPKLMEMADWARENPEKFRNVAGAIGAIAASLVAMNAAFKASVFMTARGSFGPFGVLVGAFAAAYTMIESYRVKVNAQYNSWVGMLEGVINTAVRTVNPLIDAINFVSPGNPLARLALVTIPRLDTRLASQKGAGFAALDQIPQMADGGIIRHSPGGTLAIIGEGGRDEAVIPLDRAGSMGGNNITINVQGGDPQAVVNALRTYMRQNGSVPIRVSNIF